MDPKFEAIELEGNSCFRTLHLQCAHLQDDHGWHYHPEYELTYIVAGEGTRFIGDCIEPYKSGDLVFIAPNIPHCWVNDETDNAKPIRSELLILQFLPDCLGVDFLNSPDAHALLELFERTKRGLLLTGDKGNAIRQQLLQLHQTQGLKRLSYFINVLDLISQCKGYEPLTSELYMANNSKFHRGRMREVMDYIHTNIMNEIRQTDIAKQVNMTPQGFSRFFRDTTGRTFVSFVNAVRIMEACRLLVNNEDDVSDIAFHCGYGNLSNFNRRFMELKKCTPSEYRRNHDKLKDQS